MRFFLGLILLAFPLLELWLLITLGSRYGWLFIGYLVLVGVLGYRLLKDERNKIQNLAETLRNGQAPGFGLVSSFKNIAAGILLIIPGVITDAIAVILLLVPSSKPPLAANDDVIEGEFRREE